QGRRARLKGEEPFKLAMILRLTTGEQHGREQRLLVGEVLEEKGFGDVRRIGQLPRRRAVEALFGEDPAHGLNDGRSTFFTGQFRSGPHTRFVPFSLVSIYTATEGVKPVPRPVAPTDYFPRRNSRTALRQAAGC